MRPIAQLRISGCSDELEIEMRMVAKGRVSESEVPNLLLLVPFFRIGRFFFRSQLWAHSLLTLAGR